MKLWEVKRGDSRERCRKCIRVIKPGAPKWKIVFGEIGPRDTRIVTQRFVYVCERCHEKAPPH